MMPVNFNLDTAHVLSGTLTDGSGSGLISSYTGGRLVLKPQIPGTYIKLSFTDFQLGPNDELTVYNGFYNGYNGSPIGSYKGNNLPPVIYSSLRNGSLTLHLNCQSSYLYEGFTAAVQCVSTIPPADLSFFYYPNQVAPSYNQISGSQIHIGGNIINKGSKGEPFQVSGYLSTDTLFDSNDIWLGNIIFDTLYGGSTFYAYKALPVPQAAPGDYYILNCIDPQNLIAEGNENNNIQYIKLTIKPSVNDLLFTMHHNPLLSYPGASVSVSGCLMDRGNGPLMYADVAVYLSDNNIFDAADTMIEIKQLQPASNCSSSGYLTNLTIPTFVNQGNYTLFLKADPFDLITETIENNNITSVPIHIGPPKYDISFQSSSTNASWTSGGNFYLSYSLKVTDLSLTQPFPVKITLSADTIPDPTDILLENDTAFYSYYGTINGYLNGAVPSINSGNYFIIFHIDPGNIIQEINELNNIRKTPLFIKPYETDIQLYPPSINLNQTMGSVIPLIYSTYNLKGGNCPSFSTAYYLSADTVLDNSDILVDSTNINGINGNQNIYTRDTITIPLNTLPGAYYFLTVSDNTNLINETNENNNVVYTAINISNPHSELYITNFSPTYPYYDSIPRGIAVQAWMSFSNNGNSSADTTYTAVLLSTDQFPDSNDILLLTKKTNPINLNAYHSLYVNLNIPLSIPDGDYYLIAFTDHTQLISESNESNNFKTHKIVLGAGSGTTFNLSIGGHPVHTTCQEIIYDSGGNGDYSNNEHSCLTLYPGITGNYVSLEFFFMDMEAGDQLNIYDGPTTSDPLIGMFNSMPSRIVSTHPTGAVRIKFLSNGSTTKPGFKALAKCVPYIKPDLLLTGLYFYNPGFVSGQNALINYTIKNIGTTTAGGNYTGFYLSTDSVYDPGDLHLYDALSSHVIPDQNPVNNQIYLPIPNSINPGNYYLLLKADNTDLLPEANENNNWFKMPVYIHPSKIDLITSNIYTNYGYYYSYPKYFPGGQLPVTVTIHNRLYKTLDTSVVKYYFSLDTILDSSDVSGEYSYKGTPIPGRNFDHQDTLNIPSSLSPGNYYLIVQADPLDMFPETIETNNTRYAPIIISSPTMDVAWGNLILSNYTLTPGGSLTIDYGIQNIGNIPIANGQMISKSCYLSSDTTFDSLDLKLTGIMSPMYYYGTLSTTIPTVTSPGRYYLIVRLDSLNGYPESNESNNFTHIMIDVFPDNKDVSIESYYLGYQPFFTNSYVSYTYTIKNSEYGLVNGLTVHYCLSADSILDANDTLLSTATLNIQGNSGMNIYPYHMLPAGITGMYYIILRLDPFNFISETNETNNQIIIPFNIENKNYDLSVYNNSLSLTSAAAATTISLKSILKLEGNASLNNQTVGYYFSADTLLDASDQYLTSSIVSWVSPSSASYTPTYTNATVTLPSGISNGTYYILFGADQNNITSETNESNNISYSLINVVSPTRDLYVRSVKPTEYSAAPGTNMFVKAHVYNSGSASSGSYKVGYYLSTDSIFDGGDLYLSAQLRYSVNPTACDSASFNLNIPLTVSPGDYFLIAYADYFNVVTESSETNNYFSTPINIVTRFSDFVMNSISASVSGTSPISVNYTIHHQSNLYQYNVTTAIYLSLDTIPGSSDILLSTANISSLPPGVNFWGSPSLVYPSGTQLSNYYLIIKVDYNNLFAEPNETNNIRYTRISSGNSYSYYPDLQLSNINVSDTLSTDISNPFSARINVYGATTTSSPVGIFLSSDWRLDIVDLMLASLDSGAVNYYYGKDIFADLTIPSWVNPGMYYLITAADYQNVIHENNEGNNNHIKPVYIAAVTGIVENAEKFAMIIYPNPSSGAINFKGNFLRNEWGDELVVEVISSKGEIVYSESFQNTIEIQKQLNIPDVSNGIYYLKINGKKKSSTEKYVKVD
jgi:subtilase family serine protease